MTQNADECQYPFYEAQARQFYRLLKHEGYYTQARAINVNQGKIIDQALLKGEEEVVTFAKQNNGKANVFFGRNPRNADGQVACCTSLSLDIDPVRVRGTAATALLHKLAVVAGRDLIQYFQYGVLCSSGNGSLVLFPLRKAVSKEQAEQWGRAVEAVARQQITDSDLKGQVTVDATWDAARLVKVAGCISTKGDVSLWRQARIISSACRSWESFLRHIEDGRAVARVEEMSLPPVEKGELDRSKADMALANRLQLQGFTRGEAYAALCKTAFRQGRDDDHKRIIQKVYGGIPSGSNGPSMVPGGSQREVVLWTPESGMSDYLNRHNTAEPELPTGFATIDRATHGLQRGSIFTVGGRTNCGKTTLAIGAAYNLCRVGKRVLFVSSETTFQEVWDRYIAVGTGVSAFAIQNHATNGDTFRITGFLEELKNHSLTIYDGSRPSIHVIRQAVEQAKPDVLVFDYFQHVEARDTKALEELVMDLHDMAKANNFAVLMCAQLHDRYNPGTGRMYPPTMADLKGCRVLNDESRVVLLLDWNRDQATGDEAAVVKAIMAKNKGPKQDLLLKLDRRIPRFTEEA